jgi:protein-disulfide isomerase
MPTWSWHVLDTLHAENDGAPIIFLLIFALIHFFFCLWFFVPILRCGGRLGMRRTIQRKRQTRAHRTTTRWIAAGIVSALMVVGGLIWLNTRLAPTPSKPGVSAGRVWGQADAPVSIEVFSDFQCPMCARADAILQRIGPQYIDTGKAKITFRHFAFLGMESHWAAQAAECAGEQHKFWPYAQYLFTHQAGENGGAFALSHLKRFARQVDLDPTPFDACLDSGKYGAAVQQDTQEGRRRGVQGTPTFFVRGQRLEGLLSPAQLAALIEGKPPRD